jgi:hypothetical protein
MTEELLYAREYASEDERSHAIAIPRLPVPRSPVAF